MRASLRFYSLLVTLCIFSASSLSVHAVEVEGLFSASVKVNNRHKASLEQGLRQALVQVLVKTSASTTSDIQRNPVFAAELKNGHRYVEQYGFETYSYDNSAGETQESLWLKAKFPESVIRDFLKRGNLKFWPKDRPATVVIPVLKQNGHLAVANADNTAHLQTLINRAAYKYGIPTVTQAPQSATERQLRQLWQWDKSAISSYTQGFKNDAVFVARMAMTSDNKVMGGWLLKQGESTSNVSITAASPAEFVEKGFLWLARRWSTQYALSLHSSGNEQLLRIQGIDDQQDYSALMDYLQGLDVVGQVYVLELEAKTLTLALALNADEQQFERVLVLGRKLRLHTDTESIERYYQWTGK